MSKIPNVCIIGCGIAGLTPALCLAKVHCRLLFPHSSLFVNSQFGYEVIYLEENESIAQETCYLYLVNSKVISWSLDNETRENEVICDHLLSSS
jgi:flavin-dependent dehydrogenase